MSSAEYKNHPNTGIILGSGCSRNLGVPTMANFMDKVLDKLSQSKTDVDIKGLGHIIGFIGKIKGSGAYVRTDLLNIEELYGMAEMEQELGEKSGGREVKESLNRAIYRISKRAGMEFLSKKAQARWVNTPELLDEIKRESQKEKPLHRNLGGRDTNLLAYLCLASHKDDSGKYPMFVQFNWDLALDRALYLFLSQENEDENYDKIPWYGMQDAQVLHNYKKLARVIRPHGAINWIDDRKLNPTNDYKIYEKCIDLSTLNQKTGQDKQKGDDQRPKILLDPIAIKGADDDGKPMLACHHKLEDGIYMSIVPPTWRKHAMHPAYVNQWESLRENLTCVRRIVFIGYSLPKTDLYFRHFLALALATNNYAPRVYVWHPRITEAGPVRESYMDLFAPLAREGRLYGIDEYFGNPGLLDLNRALREAKPLPPENDTAC